MDYNEKNKSIELNFEGLGYLEKAVYFSPGCEPFFESPQKIGTLTTIQYRLDKKHNLLN